MEEVNGKSRSQLANYNNPMIDMHSGGHSHQHKSGHMDSSNYDEYASTIARTSFGLTHNN